jgi:hypothetical protein
MMLILKETVAKIEEDSVVYGDVPVNQKDIKSSLEGYTFYNFSWWMSSDTEVEIPGVFTLTTTPSGIKFNLPHGIKAEASYRDIKDIDLNNATGRTMVFVNLKQGRGGYAFLIKKTYRGS